MEPQNDLLLERTEYDISSANALEHELRALTSEHTVIDLSNVKYMDTTALRVLILAAKRVGQGRVGVVTLRGINASMRRILEVVALAQFFRIE